MSHFSVLIIGDNPVNQLSPFQENNMGDCPEEYLEFYNAEIDELNNYKTGSAKMVKLPDGTDVVPWDPEAVQLKLANPDVYLEIDKPFTDIYPTLEDFMQKWLCLERDDREGHYGHWYNPNAKWDWYQLGGRWTGTFKLKENSIGKTGTQGMFNIPAKSGYVDQILKKDVDWEGMILDREPEMIKASRFWELYIEKKEAITDTDVELISFPFRSESYYIDKYKNKENYIRSMTEFSTWSVIKDSVWFEAGEMGWFGVSSASGGDEHEWESGFYNRWIKDLPDDTLLSMYDCHI